MSELLFMFMNEDGVLTNCVNLEHVDNSPRCKIHAYVYIEAEKNP